MTIQTIEHGSENYGREVQLRVRFLLDPIGIPASYIKPESEANDFHVGAFSEGQLVGCCVLTPRTQGVVQLRQMTVDEKYRGHHIGAAILKYAEKIATQNGFKKIILHARNPVIEFYSKNGYEVNGPEFFEVGIGHHQMEKTVSC